MRLSALTDPAAATLDALLALDGGVGALATKTSKTLTGCGLSSADIERLGADPGSVATLQDWLALPTHHLITWGSEDYPPLLARIPNPPAMLYALGNPDLLHLPHLAVVGSRKPTRGGLATATDFTRALTGAGLGIVSGLALGIDAAAHAAALDADGVTVAVLGTGIDRVYPAANQALATRIAGAGCLVSEFALGTEPRRGYFPRRNRLISGLALGTLVVEAALRSGSLITARLAAEQGRNVFAIPGSIHNPMARGCHRLIREGARLAESVDDVFADLEVMTETLKQVSAETASGGTEKLPANTQHAALLDAMGFEPVGIDTIAARAGLTIAEVSSMLLILELEDQVESLPGGRYSRLA